MELNEVDFSDDFYKGKAVRVNVNGRVFGTIQPTVDEIILCYSDGDGHNVRTEYNDINALVDDLETMELD